MGLGHLGVQTTHSGHCTMVLSNIFNNCYTYFDKLIVLQVLYGAISHRHVISLFIEKFGVPILVPPNPHLKNSF